MREFWPPCEAAQADYELLREAAVAGAPVPQGLAARFERGGLVGLITRPLAAPAFTAVVVGAARPPWAVYSDPRATAMADAYNLVLQAASVPWAIQEEATS
ncbi:MAG TPA: hypothetical protein VK425_06945 [Acidimicrobiales bacterium]|nr:hypothetical protein [Acidimicrobiales bacterium]